MRYIFISPVFIYLLYSWKTIKQDKIDKKFTSLYKNGQIT